jgi:hypothetical protein
MVLRLALASVQRFAEDPFFEVALKWWTGFLQLAMLVV